MNLSVVIVNWNSGPYLRRLIDSLQRLRGELAEILVLDNASDDIGLDGWTQDSCVRIIKLSENRGFAGAANEGIRRARSPFVLLLNPDIEVVPESVRSLYQEIQSHPNAAILCGALKDEKGNSQEKFQIRPFPNWRNVIADVLFLDELWDWIGKQSRDWKGAGRGHQFAQIREEGRLGGSGGARPDGLPEDGSMVPLPSGRGSVRCRELKFHQPAAACWMLRKQSWQDVGGFDPRFQPAWFEDVDFCKRVLKAGQQIVYCPQLPMIHRGGLSVSALGYPAFVTMFYQNLLRYLKKHHPVAFPFLWLLVHGGTWVRRRLIRKWKQIPAHPF